MCYFDFSLLQDSRFEFSPGPFKNCLRSTFLYCLYLGSFEKVQLFGFWYTILRFPVEITKWYYYFNGDSPQWHSADDKFRKNFLTTISEINFSKVKINELLSCFKFYATVQFVNWYSRVFKRKTSFELLKNASKIISKFLQILNVFLRRYGLSFMTSATVFKDKLKQLDSSWKYSWLSLWKKLLITLISLITLFNKKQIWCTDKNFQVTKLLLSLLLVSPKDYLICLNKYI